MDQMICAKPMPHQAKRDLSFEQQLIEARQEINQLRSQERQLALAAQKAQREPARLVRQLDNVRASLNTARLSFEATSEQMQREHDVELKEAKQQAGYTLRAYQRQMMEERKDLNERLAHLERIIGDRDREVLQYRAALRQGSKEQVKALAELEDKLEKARQGRTWDRVNEEKRRREQAEAACKEAEAEAARQQARADERNSSTARQKQQLEYFSRRTRDLEKKVADYDVRKQRGFWEVEPVAEENEKLRGELAKADKERAQLHVIVNPPPSKFYSSRETEDGKLIGGRRTSDDWDMLDMGLAVYNVPSNNVKPIVESVASFFGINLPREQRIAHCRKQGGKRKVDRSLVPSRSTHNENLEVGGEVADLITYKEIAEGSAIGLTFDGATINMYAVFGGGVCVVKKDGKVVRRMAFAEHMDRETVVNKMRKIQEFFARGKACLEILQHPLADQVDLDRAHASVSDRGGADGCVAKALEQRAVRSHERKLGQERWEEWSKARGVKLSVGPSGSVGVTLSPLEEKVGGLTLSQTCACAAVYSSMAIVPEAWAAAEYLFDNDELDRHAVDPEYESRKFHELSEGTQELLVAQQLVGMEVYSQLSEEERLHFIALFCLEHGLSNTLVAIDGGMDDYAREIVTGFIAEGKSKTKAFVEVNSSPGNKLCLAFSKLFAPCSDKDWAKSKIFQGWELEKYNVYTLADLEAILGSRFGIFFKNAKPIRRSWVHAREWLGEMEETMAEGAWRAATHSALGNRALYANFCAKEIICGYLYWPWMKLMNEVKHAFDMAPALQEAAKSLEAAIEEPSSLLTGRVRLFGEHMPVPTPSPEMESLMTELERDDELKTHVKEFIRRGMIKGLPQLLKHTAEYQAGGVAAKNEPAARAAAAALPGTAHGQEGDFGTIQYFMGSKGKARHRKLRSAAAHAKLKRNQTLDALREMAIDVRRRYLALGRLMRARRERREGRTRKDIARQHAANTKEYNQQKLADSRKRQADAAKERTELEAAPRITTMKELHHLNMPELRQQVAIRKVLDKVKLDNKLVTVGGKRPELLPRLKSMLLMENEHAADGYDINAPKTFYLSAAAAAAVTSADTSTTEHDESMEEQPAAPEQDSLHEETSPVERIEAQELRNHEVHYLIKWCGKDESENSWVSEVDLPDAYSIELAAAFEENGDEEEEEDKEEEHEMDADGEGGEEGDEEFVVQALLDRNYDRSLRRYEYLVRWGGFGPEEDSWEPADALPLDMRQEFDEERLRSKRTKRS